MRLISCSLSVCAITLPAFGNTKHAKIAIVENVQRTVFMVDSLLTAPECAAHSAVSVLVRLMIGNYQIEIGPARKVRDVRHAVGSVVTKRLQFFLILMRTHDHDVRTHVKIFTLRGLSVARLVGNPGTDIHVSNADLVDMRLLAG